ncbi:MAG: iron ABC transporter permease, partial [Methanocalculus sp.]|nr:iron ABC transporter permease [Methanocalculus sp.]
MHFDDGELPQDYLKYTHRKVLWILGGIVTLFFLLILSISVGAVSISPYEVFLTLIGQNVSTKWDAIIWNI